jgi:cytochrome c oxidase subunit II
MGRKARVVEGSLVIAIALTILTAACSGPGDTLSPAGPGAHRIDWLSWTMFAIAAFVFLVVMGLLSYGLLRRRSRSSDAPDLEDRGGLGTVLLGGVAFPIVVLIALFVITLLALQAQAHEDASGHPVTVDVIAHQWWWEFRYPDRGVTTANELHIPTGQPVLLRVTSDSVIHSLWVPRLQRKLDAIPGQTNVVTLQADIDGTYLGECAEFCGLQHANMHFQVIAQPSADFDTWVSEQQRPAPTPTDTTVERGQQLFLGSSCVYCHTVSGTNATGAVGPDLTHVASRTTLAAGTIANTPDDLARWIADPQSVKPGTQMPGTTLTPEEMQELVAYLESLG